MNGIMSYIGGRKFGLTVITMLGGVGIVPFIPEYALSPVLVFLASSLAAFCASNWAASREFHKTKMPKDGSDPAVKQLIAENKKLLKKLEEALEQGTNEEIAQSALDQFRELNQTMLTVGQTAGATLQTVQQLNQKISNILNLRNQS